MKKDVNFILLWLLILLVISIAGLSMYYYDTYQNLNANYLIALSKMRDIQEKLNSTLLVINAREQELKEKERILSDYIEKLNLSKRRDFQWENIYRSVKGEKEELENENKKLKKDLNDIKNELDMLSMNYSIAKLERDTCRRNLSNANAMLTEFREDRESIRSEIPDVESKIDDMIDDLRDIKDDAKGLKNAFRDDKTMDEIKDEAEKYADHIYMKSNKLSNTVNEIEDIISRIKSRLKEI